LFCLYSLSIGNLYPRGLKEGILRYFFGNY
jgi:hypothetical protein